MAIDIRTGKKVTREAVEPVTDRSPAWIAQVVEIIKQVAIKSRDFTTDEVWAECATKIRTPLEPRIMGVALKQAQTNAWIDKTDRVRKSTRPACHSRPVAIWRSLIHVARKAK